MSPCTHIDQVGHLVERLHQPEGVQLVGDVHVDVVGALRVSGGAGRPLKVEEVPAVMLEGFRVTWLKMQQFISYINLYLVPGDP